MPTRNDLTDSLHRIDGKSYPTYKDLRGRYDFDHFTLSIEHVQGDPFAAPSRLSIQIQHEHSRLPADLFSNKSRRTGTETFLATAFATACRDSSDHLGSGKSGLLTIDAPGQQVLHRTCCQITEDVTIIRFVAGLPASGRRILGRAAARLLTETIPDLVEAALRHQNLDAKALTLAANTNENADALRAQLDERGLIAFVANGAILPRASGVDDRPMNGAVPFQSPDSLQTSLTLPHGGDTTGMGIPAGVTLIVGGGYHGKSTLLNALEHGIYNHRPHDGRELVVSRANATKVRAEDGRSVVKVDLSPFINNLPGGKDTTAFTSENASGSTSQAASIMEAIEAGARCLLLDEDISATNFLIRDERMQQLIAPEKEPITPFVQRVRSLYDDHGVSTILVLGGSGDYFGPADRVLAMDNYLPHDLTTEAKQLAGESVPSTFRFPHSESPRVPDPSSINPFKSAPPYRGNRGGGDRASRPPRQNIKAHGTRALNFGSEEIDLSLLSQLVDDSQVRAIGRALAYAKEHTLDGHTSLPEALENVTALISANGLTALDPRPPGDLAEFRLQEFAATLNRLRSLQIL